MKQYLNLLRDILDHGQQRGDRTNTGTISLFGPQMEFDLQEGFPATTTKKLLFRKVKTELLWFLRGGTNVAWLHEHNNHIWDEWMLSDLEVGVPSEERPLIWVDQKNATSAPFSGNLSTLGLDASRGSTDDRLRNLWVKIMQRCYDSDHHNFRFYGGRGVGVVKEWHDVNTFVHGVKNLPNWGHKNRSWNEYELDKDYYGATAYGPDTCVWLHTSENNYYTLAVCPVRITPPTGRPLIYLTQAHAARDLDISTSAMSRYLERGSIGRPYGRSKRLEGWGFEYLKRPGKFLRMAFSKGDLGPVYGSMWRSWPSTNGDIDQLAGVIHGIRNHPESRRLLVSAWNVSLIEKMALPPCHIQFQFYVRHADDGPDFLDCKMYQRSADMFLGVPFNIASYALLTHMMAQVCELRPGRFVHTFGDVHIYANHVDQVEEQLSREPGEVPSLWLNPDIDDIDGFGPKDIRLVDYKHQGVIRAPIAVGGTGFIPTIKE